MEAFELTDHTLGRTRLNSVSSQCAHGKSSIARKMEVHHKKCLWQKTFQKCNPSAVKFYLGKFNDTNFHHMVQCKFCVFTVLNNTKKQRKFDITPYGEKFLLVNLLG